MAVVCSFGLQKGGVGKSSLTGIVGYLLAEQGERVLCVDYDSQGNLTQLLTGKSPYEFVHQTSLEAVKEGNAKPYITNISQNLDLLPAEDFLSSLSRWMYQEYKQPDMMLLLRKALEPVMEDYSWILLDLPPNLGEQTLTGICASDFCVVVSTCDPFSMDAIDRYLEMVRAAKDKVRPEIRLAGIVLGLLDARTTIGQHIMERVKEDYEELVFRTVIRRKSRIIEYSFEGISSKGKQDREALEMYQEFIKELKERVQS